MRSTIRTLSMAAPTLLLGLAAGPAPAQVVTELGACANGIDDDGDGVTDCADRDCIDSWDCAIFVDPVNGSDLNDGRCWTRAKQSIAGAELAVSALGTGNIRLAAGNYGHRPSLFGPVHVYGGYPRGGGPRSPFEHVSLLMGLDLESATDVLVDGVTIAQGDGRFDIGRTIGGGVFVRFGQGVTIRNTVITANRIFAHEFDLLLDMNGICDDPDLHDGLGAGVFIEASDDILLDNVLIHDNVIEVASAGDGCEGMILPRGGGLYAESDVQGLVLRNVTLTNNGILTNSFQGSGDGAQVEGDYEIIDSILWGNWGTTFDDLFAFLGVESYSSIGVGPCSGMGCISVDPTFQIGALGDHYLAPTPHPCVDGGSRPAAAAGLDTWTTQTNHVGDDGIVDMGFHYLPSPIVELTEDCANGIDDDLDCLADCADPDCSGQARCETGNCADGIDNDQDGLTDCADADCSDDPACPEQCTNGLDDDADGDVDCADDECAMDAACIEAGNCADGVDNDLDMLVDCADDECAADAACANQDHDADGVLNGNDCAPTDGTLWMDSPPVDRIDVTKETSNFRVSWQAPTGMGIGTPRYQYGYGQLDELHARRSIDDLTCRNLSTTTALHRLSYDAYLLVRALNDCGPSAGTNWGSDSFGTARVGCP